MLSEKPLYLPSLEVQVQVLICSLEQVRLFAGKFEAAVKRYKDTYYSDRSQVAFVFLPHTIYE